MAGEIERGVPPPPGRSGFRNPVSVALLPLRPGESRVVKLPKQRTQAHISRIAFRLFGKGHYRTAPAERPGTVRVWRLA